MRYSSTHSWPRH